jgi:hypothetical protein
MELIIYTLLVLSKIVFNLFSFFFQENRIKNNYFHRVYLYKIDCEYKNKLKTILDNTY